MPKSWLTNMTREDVIRIALEVGFYDGEVDKCQLMLERFAYLVAKQERDGIIAMAESPEFNRIRGEFNPTSTDLVNAIRARGQA